MSLLATYALLFARPPSRLRILLAWLSYGVAFIGACIGFVQIAADWFAVFDPSSPAFTNNVAGTALPAGLPLLCGLVTCLETRGAERMRFLCAFVPLALMFAGVFVDSLYPGLPGFHSLDNVLAFIAPLGLVYSLLSRRVMDIGFVLNRAAVFSAVSVVLVGTFILMEWALSDWMSRVSHETNIAISGALALVLGLSIRFVHGKVEHVVDHVVFRKRREDEEAIRRMAREAPYITDQETLLERVRQTLLQHAGASFVNVLLNDGHAHYSGISENDPALVTLRAEHARVDLQSIQTALKGEWAYPMVARGRLVGALVLGQKQTQESYAPDESAAIAQLAHSVAGAIDVLTLKSGGERNAVLDAIQELSQAMHAGFERFADLRADPVD
jgi:hypothetical protein